MFRRYATAMLCLALCAGPLLADLAISGALQVAPGKLVKLDVGDVKVGTNTKIVWKVHGLTNGADGKVVSADMIRVGSQLIFAGPPGDYQVDLRVIDFDLKFFDEGSAVVTIGTPTPPTPPTPPVPPAPTDPLTKAFQAAYDTDMDADRATSLAWLVGCYKGMAAAATTRTDLKTNADFVRWMKTVVEAPGTGITATQLRTLRTVIAVELSGAWGATPAPLAAADAAAELLKIYTGLRGVK